MKLHKSQSIIKLIKQLRKKLSAIERCYTQEARPKYLSSLSNSWSVKFLTIVTLIIIYNFYSNLYTLWSNTLHYCFFLFYYKITKLISTHLSCTLCNQFNANHNKLLTTQISTHLLNVEIFFLLQICTQTLEITTFLGSDLKIFPYNICRISG